MDLIVFLLIFWGCSDAVNENMKERNSSTNGSVYDGNEKSPPATAPLLSVDIPQCPSTSVIRVKYKCRSSSKKWSDCMRSQCCPGYNLIGGKCISKTVDLCTFSLCEQRCDVIFRQVICTCWNGFRFSPEHQERGEKPSCIDIDECKDGTHDCEQICVNKHGDFSCDCNEGFTLHVNDKTCERVESSKKNEESIEGGVSCDIINSLRYKVEKLQERMTALETAIKLAAYPSTSEPTPHSTDDEMHKVSAAYLENHTDKTYSVLDSYVRTTEGYCKCQRGPIGPIGPAGISGQKGEFGDRGPRGSKGATGSLDLFLLLLADVRHDVIILQERIFPGKISPKFDFETALKKQRSVYKKDLEPDIENFRASETLRFSDYSTTEDSESSGDGSERYE